MVMTKTEAQKTCTIRPEGKQYPIVGRIVGKEFVVGTENGEIIVPEDKMGINTEGKIGTSCFFLQGPFNSFGKIIGIQLIVETNDGEFHVPESKVYDMH